MLVVIECIVLGKKATWPESLAYLLTVYKVDILFYLSCEYMQLPMCHLFDFHLIQVYMILILFVTLSRRRLCCRVLLQRLNLTRYSLNVARYRMLLHNKSDPNPQRYLH